MRRWLKNVVIPCFILSLGFVACGGSKKSGSGGSSTDSGGMGGTSSSTTSPDSGGASSSSDTGGTGGTAGTGGMGGSGDGSGGTGGILTEQTGSSCETADDCYDGLDTGDLGGDVMCLDRVEGGYCTHECTSDDDCCAVEGECDETFVQVCGPFESTGLMLCFLSCEDEDVAATDAEDADEFCADNAGPDFICRSTGGGQNNRRVCVPGDNTPGVGGAGGMGGEGGQAGGMN